MGRHLLRDGAPGRRTDTEGLASTSPEATADGRRKRIAYFLALVAAPAFGRFAPYFERDCLRSLTPCVSSEPRTMW